MARFSESKFGKRDLTAKNHWTELDFANFKITRPTLICIGGNGTTDSHNDKGERVKAGTRKINGICAMAERLVGLQENDVDEYSSYHTIDILGFSYGKTNQSDTIGSFSSEEEKKIMENMLLPLCMDIESGEIYSLEEICYNFSLITFFTHCWGAREIGIIFGKLNNELLCWGFKREEIDKIFSCVNHITYSPYTDEAWTPTFRIDSLTDSLHRGLDKTFEAAYGHKLNGIEIKNDEAGWLYNKRTPHVHQPVTVLWTSRLVNTTENSDLRNIYDEHSIEAIDRNGKWETVQKGNNADAVSKIAGYVLAKCLSKSVNNYRAKELLPTQTLPEMVDEASDILGAYDEDDLRI